MRCPFCYIPFDGKSATEQVATSVLLRIMTWEVKSITFGGGDPFIYPYFPRLLDRARREEGSLQLVQVDTNGLGLSQPILAAVARKIDLLGLPLDAACEATSVAMRRHRRHWQTVPYLIEVAFALGITVKVNTVVSRLNLDDIEGIGSVVASSGAKRWSLYEFWPIGPGGTMSRSNYDLPVETFQATVKKMRATYPQLTVESGSILERRSAYFFVTQSGDAYTVDPTDTTAYLDLGNILSDAEVLNRWREAGDPEANRGRYLSRLYPRRSTQG